MNPETLRILDSIARDRNIDRELLIRDLVADGQLTPGNQQRLCISAQGQVLGPAVDPAFVIAPVPLAYHLSGDRTFYPLKKGQFFMQRLV
jgi:hypothetical protein